MITFIIVFVVTLLLLVVVGLACQYMRERADNERLIEQNHELSRKLAAK